MSPLTAIRDLPIRHKLTLINLLTSCVALLLASAGFIEYEQFNFKRELLADLASTARMVGFNSASAISFDDADSAAQTLKGLSAHSHIIAATLYDKHGASFATYQRSPTTVNLGAPPSAATERFERDYAERFEPVLFSGQTVGMIGLRSDLDALHARLRRYAMITSVLMVISILAAYGIASRLQRTISKPVSDLVAVTEGVASGEDYSARAVKRSNDELGRLIDGFNHMLAQIQARDNALRSAHDHLEKRVEERTEALQQENAERRLAETALKAAKETAERTAQALQLEHAEREKFFALVENSIEFVGIASLEGQLLYINPAGRRLVGIEKGDTLSAIAMQELFDDESWKRQKDVILRSVLQNGHWEGESRLKHLRTGGPIEVWSQNFLVRHPQTGEPLCLATTKTDIRERKRTEAELEAIHRQLVVSSRQAGMAEVATGVLHNVGNVLNSVNVSATLVSNEVAKSKSVNVGKISALLQSNLGDLATFFTHDARGQQIPRYLQTLSEQLNEERAEVLNELKLLCKNIEHIKDIVTTQQSYAKTSGVTETLSLLDLVEDALRMNAGALVRHDVTLVRDFPASPTVTVEKHKVLQILVNLLGNAKHSCDDSGRSEKQITVRVTEAGGRGTVTVIDNGVGIPPENITRIFAHGFTTRKGGHGFGLHSGALAAKELGGSLNAFSVGLGQGATFALELPLAACPCPNLPV